MFRWIIDDTRALIADLRALARRMTRSWQWWRFRSRHRVEDAAAELENVRRAAQATTRMCRNCRALISVGESRCPECGEAPGKPVSKGLMRVLENMVPGAISASSVILTANVILYLISLTIDMRLAGGGLPHNLKDSSWSVTLIALGANSPGFVAGGELWRLLTSVFLHGGLLHLAMNSWCLLAVGPLIEEIYGSRKFLVFYLSTGIGGSLLSFLVRQGTFGPGIGASGAIFGMIGLAAVWGWRRGGAIGEGIRGQMVQWAIYGLVMGYFFRADNWAHLGGLICGAGLAMLVDEGEPRSGGGSRLWEILAYLSVVAVMASFSLVMWRYAHTIALLIEL